MTGSVSPTPKDTEAERRRTSLYERGMVDALRTVHIPHRLGIIQAAMAVADSEIAAAVPEGGQVTDSDSLRSSAGTDSATQSNLAAVPEAEDGWEARRAAQRAGRERWEASGFTLSDCIDAALDAYRAASQEGDGSGSQPASPVTAVPAEED